ncbi:MAG: SDR family NAD(P)-dependent oxidoreductase [Gammaproteobacteria bacterium]|jgi:short-subunit dehydrogenase|nr:SDR family NAD(P)-dependent oxidoreductase [Gammaproteobacteria bacterium]
MELTNQQKYWITGATSGIGRALCIELAQLEHKLIISSRNAEELGKLALEYPKLIQILPCDVSNNEEMAELFSTKMPTLKNLDGIFLCAGVCEYIDLPKFNLDAFQKAVAINYLGTVNSCAAAYPLLSNSVSDMPNKKPFIAGLCSMSSYLGFPRAEAYGASKAAMAYFLNSLRADIGDKIDVIPVYLGFVKTPMTAQNDFPMPFLISPEEAARGILNKLTKRPLRINLPWRLHAVLGTFSKLQRLWYQTIIPRMRRSRNVT